MISKTTKKNMLEDFNYVTQFSNLILIRLENEILGDLWHNFTGTSEKGI